MNFLRNLLIKKTLFTHKLQEIKANSAKYIYKESIENEIEQALQDMEEERTTENENNLDNDQFEKINEFAIFELNDAEADIAVEMPNIFANSMIPSDTRVEKIPCPQLLSNEEYYQLIRDLNTEQYMYHINLVYLIRNKPNKQIFHFINGNAGVGKSRLIKAIVQTLIRHENSIPGHNPENIPVIVSAYTGKAASIIKGATLHSLFKLNYGNNSVKRLSSDILNTLRVKFFHTRHLIIDLSLVGKSSTKLTCVSKKLWAIPNYLEV